MRGPNQKLLDLLLELETLDRVPRSGFFLRGISDCESIAEHTFHVAALVWLLAPSEPGLDRARAVELALVHDLAEVRVGDLPRIAAKYFPPGAKHEAERKAIGDLLAPADPETIELYLDYERSGSREARFVRACDRLQLLLKAAVYEGWGHGGMAEFWDRAEQRPPSEFESIERLRDELTARRASRTRD